MAKKKRIRGIVLELRFFQKDGELLQLIQNAAKDEGIEPEVWAMNALAEKFILKEKKERETVSIADAPEEDVDAWLRSRTVKDEPKEAKRNPFGKFGDMAKAVEEMPKSVREDDGVPNIPAGKSRGEWMDVPVSTPRNFKTEVLR